MNVNVIFLILFFFFFCWKIYISILFCKTLLYPFILCFSCGYPYVYAVCHSKKSKYVKTFCKRVLNFIKLVFHISVNYELKHWYCNYFTSRSTLHICHPKPFCINDISLFEYKRIIKRNVFFQISFQIWYSGQCLSNDIM